jgi:hypothetical protein
MTDDGRANGSIAECLQAWVMNRTVPPTIYQPPTTDWSIELVSSQALCLASSPFCVLSIPVGRAVIMPYVSNTAVWLV